MDPHFLLRIRAVKYLFISSVGNYGTGQVSDTSLTIMNTMRHNEKTKMPLRKSAGDDAKNLPGKRKHQRKTRDAVERRPSSGFYIKQ